jgi:hypothetical protein
MIIAGTRLTDTEVAALADKLRDADMSECADRVEHAFQDGERMFSLSADERGAFFDALNDCPDELLQLRTSLHEQLV